MMTGAKRPLILAVSISNMLLICPKSKIRFYGFGNILKKLIENNEEGKVDRKNVH